MKYLSVIASVLLCSLVYADDRKLAIASLPTPKFASLPVPKFGVESADKPVVKPVPVVGKYVDKPGYHRHRCNYDGTIWEHTPGGSHSCPVCGREQYYHYKGDLPPTAMKRVEVPLFNYGTLYRSPANCPTGRT